MRRWNLDGLRRSAKASRDVTQRGKWPKNPHAKALGKLGGQVKSAAKAAAARENGKKGGRPRKVLNPKA